MIRLAKPEFDDKEIEAVKSVLKSGWLIQGENVTKFEHLVANYVGTQYAIAANSGTSALHLALISLGLSDGDEVITSDLTFPATANVIEIVGAKPVFVDIKLDTYNIDYKLIEDKITSRTKAVIPVHLYGQMANMEPILELSKMYNLKIIEDAAPALGATYQFANITKKAGSLGNIGCFSFHPRKIITTGEGGMITTNDKQLADKLQRLRNHGMIRQENKTDFVLPGLNNRMTEMQAAIGIAQMDKLDYKISRHQQIAQIYNSMLSDIEWLRIPKTLNNENHTYQAYVILLDSKIDRDKLLHHLSEKGIETSIGTYSLHQIKYYRHKYGFCVNAFPNAKIAFEHSLALPLYSSMSENDVEYVTQNLKQIGSKLL